MENFGKKLARVMQERVTIEAYNPVWPELFEKEKRYLTDALPVGLLRRIEHFGSTAVPGLSAKPIIDMLVEVSDLVQARMVVVPILEKEGYEYIWRPSFGGDIPPYYAWFIKRDEKGNRTHHLHFIESHFVQWDTLFFRDYLIEHPEVAAEYNDLKSDLSKRYGTDRDTYSRAKGDFIRKVTARAKLHYATRKC